MHIPPNLRTTTNGITGSTPSPLILPTEDPADFDALLESLTAEYQPETEMQQFTVREAARRAWQLGRLNHAFDKCQEKLYRDHGDMSYWTLCHHATFERILQYRTKAERSHERALRRLEYLRKLRIQAGECSFRKNLENEKLALSKQRLELAAAPLRRAEAKAAQDAAVEQARQKEQDRLHTTTLRQTVLITRPAGVTTVEFLTKTADLLYLADHYKIVTPISRFIDFPDGIPPEYAWVQDPDLRMDTRLGWTQSFATVQEWREHTAQEAALGRVPPKRKLNSS